MASNFHLIPATSSHFLKSAYSQLLAIMTIVCSLAAATATAQTLQGTQFSYQGQLKIDGQALTDTADFEFTLWDSDSAGNMTGSLVSVNNVLVEDGRFTVQLDFGVPFNGDARWLEIAVRSPAGGGGFSTLAPRQPLTATPYALALRGLRTTASGDGALPDSWNVIGGHPENSVGAGVAGATISGGGNSDIPNIVSSNFGTVGGGQENIAGAFVSTVGGGRDNFASGIGSTVGGGSNNIANGLVSTVGGGQSNIASGSVSMVPGGWDCQAGGESSLAAGRRAIVRDPATSGDTNGDEGTFVWADSTNADFTSTGANQFLIRAIGGVGIGTSSPSNQLSVQGDADFTGNVGIGTDSPSNQLTVVGNAEVTGNGSDALYIENTSDGRGIRAVAPLDTAVWALTTTGFAGVHGRNAGESGRAVYGEATASSGTNYGVYGRSNSASGYDFYAGGAGVNYGASSSRRWKNNAVPIDDPLHKIGQLRGVYFDWDEKHGGAHDVGMIAEEVGAVLPEVVQYEENGIDASGMDYSKMTPLLVEAVKELRAEKNSEIRALRAEKDAQISKQADRITKQNDQVLELRDRIEQLEHLVTQLTSEKK